MSAPPRSSGPLVWPALAAALAVVAWLIAFARIGHSPAAVVAMPRLLQVAAADAFIALALLLLAAGPLAGVALYRREGPRRGTILLGASVGALVLVSAALTWAARGAAASAAIAQSHAALAAVAFALGTLGVLCAALWRHPLDAAACALLASAAAGGALVAAGPAAGNLTERAIEAGLLASPAIALAAAADIDLLRTEALYQLTPLARRRFAYPEWSATVVAYFAGAALCVAGALVARRGHTSPPTVS